MINKLLEFLKMKIKGRFFSSETYIDFLRSKGATIGENTYFYAPKEIKMDETSLQWLSIGDNVQITSEVEILLHDYSYSVLGNKFNILPEIKKRTIIGNNVFIGHRVIILPGAKIGNDTIIGAGSVVSGNIDSNSVYAGNPAKKIRTIFEHKNLLEKKFPFAAYEFSMNFKREHDRFPTEFEMGIYRPLFSRYTGKNHKFMPEKFVAVNKEVFEKGFEIKETYSSVAELVEKLTRSYEQE